MTSTAAPPTPRLGYRWTICALLFAVTTINYMDRQVLSILAPTLQRELTWSESQYAAVVYSFTLVYAFGFLIALVSFDFGLTTVSSCFLIWLETVRDHPVPTLPM